METKNIYEAPETVLVDFQAEGILCQSGTPKGGGAIDDLVDTMEDLFN